jgi:hypothetical protein
LTGGALIACVSFLIQDAVGTSNKWLASVIFPSEELTLRACSVKLAFVGDGIVEFLAWVAFGFVLTLICKLVKDLSLCTLHIFLTLVDASVKELCLRVALDVRFTLTGLLVEEHIIADNEFIALIGLLVESKAFRTRHKINTLVVNFVQPFAFANDEVNTQVGLLVKPLTFANRVILALSRGTIEELVSLASDNADASV